MKPLEKELQARINKGKVIIVPYIMAGDNGLEDLERQLLFLESQGVSSIEVGIPFSDPVADGLVIQAAGLRSLKNKVTLAKIITELQKSNVQVPIVIMSYFNPLFHYGLEKFVAALKNTPVKGLIIPDLPYEHRQYLTPLLKDTSIAFIPLISLTSSKERIKEITQQAEGFIYAVTVNGTTGERKEFGDGIEEHLAYLKQISPVPVLAGFGVSEVKHIHYFADHCDGVIVGSLVVNKLHEKKEQELQTFLQKAIKIPATRILE